MSITSPSIVQLAEAQHGLITFEQASALGLSRAAWRHQLRLGDWERVTRRVARRSGAPRTAKQAAMVAVLDCGPSTYLSHGSAAALWDLPGFRLEPLHVTIERGARETPSDRATVHRPRHLPDPFGTVLHGIPVVRPALLALQLCATLTPARAERAFDTAWSKRLLSGPSVRRELDPLLHRGRAGTALLRELLEARGPDYVPPASGLEARFESILAQAGESPLRRQVDVGDDERWCGRVDYLDPRLPLLVEIDSERYHAALADARADAERTARLRAAGYLVERVTDHQVWHRPSEVLAAVRRARAEARRLGRAAA